MPAPLTRKTRWSEAERRDALQRRLFKRQDGSPRARWSKGRVCAIWRAFFATLNELAIDAVRHRQRADR
jgi:hypothetical protein